jgi:hypothetical protein
MILATQSSAAAEVGPATLVQAADHVPTAATGQGQLPVRAVIAVGQQNVAGFQVVLQGMKQGRADAVRDPFKQAGCPSPPQVECRAFGRSATTDGAADLWPHPYRGDRPSCPIKE